MALAFLLAGTVGFPVSSAGSYFYFHTLCGLVFLFGSREPSVPAAPARLGGSPLLPLLEPTLLHDIFGRAAPARAASEPQQIVRGPPKAALSRSIELKARIADGYLLPSYHHDSQHACSLMSHYCTHRPATNDVRRRARRTASALDIACAS